MLSEVITPEGRDETIVNLHSSGKKNQVARPREGVWYVVRPNKINQELFQKERDDPKQENTRKFILEAFTKMEERPEKYGRPFATMIPKKRWEWKTPEELKELANILGDHNADWIEQALEWAQRIQNGETWEELCNKQDTAMWYRLVVGNDDFVWVVGAKKESRVKASASTIFKFAPGTRVYYSTVPLVVRYI